MAAATMRPGPQVARGTRTAPRRRAARPRAGWSGRCAARGRRARCARRPTSTSHARGQRGADLRRGARASARVTSCVFSPMSMKPEAEHHLALAVGGDRAAPDLVADLARARRRARGPARRPRAATTTSPIASGPSSVRDAEHERRTRRRASSTPPPTFAVVRLERRVARRRARGRAPGGAAGPPRPATAARRRPRR